MERKQFYVESFISNEITPVETRDGRKVIIYNTKRPNTTYKVCGDVIDEGEFGTYYIVVDWSARGEYDIDIVNCELDLFFSIKE